jgi:hypothetical protein
MQLPLLKMNRMKPLYVAKICMLIAAFCGLLQKQAHAQAELMPYGNLNGIRIKGQLMDFNTSIALVGSNWHKINATAKERQRPKFKRDGDVETVNTAIDSLLFTETVEDIGKGKIRVSITCNVRRDTSITGVYLSLRLPKPAYENAVVSIKDQAMATEVLKDDMPTVTGKGISFTASGKQQFSISTKDVGMIIRPQSDGLKYIQLYFPVCEGALKKGDSFTKTFEIKVSGDIDNTDATLQLDTTVQGREFAGLGGNFRLQNPRTDPQVIDYCLKNLRVAWGRLEMPWHDWQPDMNTDPTLAADSGKLNGHVKASMEMAQRLGQMHMPVVLTAWAPPAWAVIGPLHNRPTPAGVWGNPLNNDNTQQIYKSITDYIIYLKNHYGVEADYFSFNESDLGINIRQTGQEHLELIKGLGRYFAGKGLKTKLLLGDNSDATTYKFIYPAMADAEARQYIGAVSFHSWRGWDTETLQKWADAATKLNVPLLVGEGSIDAAAWAYPAYFEEQSYALEEINLYTRLLAICQPISILQWQLTADYSPLSGGGIFGNNEPLKPTQRFWQLQQLANTPANLKAMPISVNKQTISCAALGDVAKHSYTIHLVNNSAARKVYLKGLPASVTRLKVFVTDKNHNVKQKGDVKVKDHQAVFKLGERGFTTLMSE